MKIKESSLFSLGENEKESLKVQIEKSNRDYVAMAKSFTDAISIIKSKINEFQEPDKIKKIIGSFDFVEDLEELLQGYGDGKNWGDYYVKEDIKSIVARNRGKMISFLREFKLNLLEEGGLDF